MQQPVRMERNIGQEPAPTAIPSLKQGSKEPTNVLMMSSAMDPIRNPCTDRQREREFTHQHFTDLFLYNVKHEKCSKIQNGA